MKHFVGQMRLLPATIATLALVLLFKTTALTRALIDAEGTGVVTVAEAATPNASSAPARAAQVPTQSAQPPQKPAASPTAPSPTAPSPAAAATPQPKAPVATPVAAGPVAPSSEPSESERAVLQELRDRRRALDTRDAALSEREHIVAAAERRLMQRVAELEALQAKLETLEKARQAQNETNWRGLVMVYEKMKPAQAASIFDNLDDAVLLPLLDRMKELKAAPILAAMRPDRARDATAALAKLRTASVTPVPMPASVPVPTQPLTQLQTPTSVQTP